MALIGIQIGASSIFSAIAWFNQFERLVTYVNITAETARSLSETNAERLLEHDEAIDELLDRINNLNLGARVRQQ